MAHPTLCIGLMSGTSLDGVDGVLADFSGERPEVLAQASLAMPAALRAELLALNTPGHDELGRAALAANALVQQYAQVVAALLYRGEAEPRQIAAIGAHGQTVRHRPELGYTLQLNAPALLAELTGIGVVADFRSRDVAAGGQGAPLAPLFHDACFAAQTPRAILNLGGIANVTLLRRGRPPVGFDTGPANVLMDLWCARHTGQAFDADGRWAAGGHADAQLLGLLLAEPWLALPPPKSTGRDLFNAAWLDGKLAALGRTPAPQDVQATLRQYTAQTVADAIGAHGADIEQVLVCGGGARNRGLMQALAQALSRPVRGTDAAGVPPQLVEALAFAWLAWQHVRGRALPTATVTGSRGARVLGAWYPA
ncbi:anhydro-N-acetylmuramic acid kinase [Orrella sp. JC864]